MLDGDGPLRPDGARHHRVLLNVAQHSQVDIEELLGVIAAHPEALADLGEPRAAQLDDALVEPEV